MLPSCLLGGKHRFPLRIPWRPNMLKKLLIATAAGGLMMSTALAQQQAPAPAPSAPAATPATPKADDKAAMPKADEKAAMKADAKFVGKQTADQWLASKFKGTDVVGADNQKIGDVGDI